MDPFLCARHGLSKCDSCEQEFDKLLKKMGFDVFLLEAPSWAYTQWDTSLIACLEDDKLVVRDLLWPEKVITSREQLLERWK